MRFMPIDGAVFTGGRCSACLNCDVLEGFLQGDDWEIEGKVNLTIQIRTDTLHHVHK